VSGKSSPVTLRRSIAITVALRLALSVLLGYALVALTFVVPRLNSIEPPYTNLAGPVGVAAYWVAESGGAMGAPIVCAVMIGVAVGRGGLTRQRRSWEAGVMAGVLLVVLGGGAYLNEHVVKPIFRVPRPDIVELAHTPADAPALRMSAEAFYNMPDKAARSAYLTDVLTADALNTAKLDPLVRRHWIAETGYSFPSGHAFASWTIATFFLAMAMMYFTGRRMWAFYLLLPWAVLVCYSRTILRVHTPTDVCAGAAAGILVGLAAFLLARCLLGRLEQEIAEKSAE